MYKLFTNGKNEIDVFAAKINAEVTIIDRDIHQQYESNEYISSTVSLQVMLR